MWILHIYLIHLHIIFICISLPGHTDIFGGEVSLKECYLFDMGPVSSGDEVGELIYAMYFPGNHKYNDDKIICIF